VMSYTAAQHISFIYTVVTLRTADRSMPTVRSAPACPKRAGELWIPVAPDCSCETATGRLVFYFAGASLGQNRLHSTIRRDEAEIIGQNAYKTATLGRKSVAASQRSPSDSQCPWAQRSLTEQLVDSLTNQRIYSAYTRSPAGMIRRLADVC
jgi:hypothetical protein